MTVDYSLMADLVSECMDKSSPDANLSLEVRADVRALPVDALEYELAMITSAKPVNDNLKLQVDERKEIEHKGDE
jgi:hypothetical protein